MSMQPENNVGYRPREKKGNGKRVNHLERIQQERDDFVRICMRKNICGRRIYELLCKRCDTNAQQAVGLLFRHGFDVDPGVGSVAVSDEPIYPTEFNSQDE